MYIMEKFRINIPWFCYLCFKLIGSEMACERIHFICDSCEWRSLGVKLHKWNLWDCTCRSQFLYLKERIYWKSRVVVVNFGI